MKIEDFEKAINALNRGIEIDEIKVRKRQVHHVYAHIGTTLLMWGSSGLAYSLDVPYSHDESLLQALQEVLRNRHYTRHRELDLRFD